ncbi:MAG: type II toxin-antitoxin system VapB family antitoxin [Vicinamibacterales bacterium]
MKRTNVVLDEQLLEDAVRVSGEKTYARTIERALTELVQRAKAQRIDRYAGSGVWQGDLAEMRRDQSPSVRETPGVYRPRKRRAAR